MKEKRYKIKYGIRFLLIGILFLSIIGSLIYADTIEEYEDSFITYDAYNRPILVDYKNSDEGDYSIFYWTQNEEYTPEEINIGSGAQKMYYDQIGNLIYEEFADSPERNTRYSYQFNSVVNSSVLKSVTTNDVETTLFYDYINEDYPLMITKETIKILGKGGPIPIYYDYDSKGRLTKEYYPTTTYSYEYDELDRVITDDFLFFDKYSYPNGYSYSISKTYDKHGNLVKSEDTEGREEYRSYSPKEYDCSNLVCSDQECTSYTTVDETCEYYSLDGAYDKNLDVVTGSSEECGLDGCFTDTYSCSNVEDCQGSEEGYCDEQKIAEGKCSQDELGFLIYDKYFGYGYDGSGVLKNITSRQTGNSMQVDYNGKYDETRTLYDGSIEKDLSDPFGRNVRVTLYAKKAETSDLPVLSLTSIFSNLFNRITGHAVINTGDYDVTEYINLEPGKEGFSDAYYTGDELEWYLDKERLINISSPLAEVLEDYENYSKNIENCVDYDAFLGNKQSLFEPSYTSYLENNEYDYCLNNRTLMESKCKWLFGDYQEYKEVECEFGCFDGACLFEKPIVPNCSDGILNQNEIEIDCGGVCNLCGKGTEKEPYKINSCNDLQKINNKPDSYYIIVNDLTCSGTFSPIPYFNGTLNGLGHSINGLEFRRESNQAMILDNYGVIERLNVNIDETFDATSSAILVLTNYGNVKNIQMVISMFYPGEDSSGIILTNNGILENSYVYITHDYESPTSSSCVVNKNIGRIRNVIIDTVSYETNMFVNENLGIIENSYIFGGDSNIDGVERISEENLLFSKESRVYTGDPSWDFENVWQENSDRLPTLKISDYTLKGVCHDYTNEQDCLSNPLGFADEEVKQFYMNNPGVTNVQGSTCGVDLGFDYNSINYVVENCGCRYVNSAIGCRLDSQNTVVSSVVSNDLPPSPPEI